MANDAKLIYGVRVGDDGRWHGKYPSLDKAREHAARLSDSGSLFMAQIVAFDNSNYRESWRNGKRV